MPKSKKLVFPFILLLFEIATYLSSDMYLPALPSVMRDFSISHSQAQWTLTAWFLGAISVQLILGPLSDRYGRKKVLCFGGVIFLISTFLCVVAPTLRILLIARFIQGSGVCFVAVPGYASIHESFEQKEAIRFLTLMGSISVLAPALGPLLGSAILTVFNWRWIFGFLLVWSSIAIVLLIILMPETLPLDKRHRLKLSIILSNYGQILRNFRFLKLVVVLGLLFCGFITWIAAGPFLVIAQFKQSPVYFGIYQTLIFMCYILANHLVKKLIQSVQLKKLIQIGLIICLGISIVSMGISIQWPFFMRAMIFTYMVYAFGSGFVFAPLNRIAIEASDAPMGSKMAIFSTFMSGFATLGSLLVGWFYNGTLFSLAAIIFAVMIISFILERTVNY